MRSPSWRMVLVVSGFVPAQEPSPVAAIEARLLPEVTTRLSAADAPTVARVGYLVQRFHLEHAIPAVSEALRQRRDPEQLRIPVTHTQAARRARLERVLDGLRIQR